MNDITEQTENEKQAAPAEAALRERHERIAQAFILAIRTKLSEKGNDLSEHLLWDEIKIESPDTAYLRKTTWIMGCRRRDRKEELLPKDGFEKPRLLIYTEEDKTALNFAGHYFASVSEDNPDSFDFKSLPPEDGDIFDGVVNKILESAAG